MALQDIGFLALLALQPLGWLAVFGADLVLRPERVPGWVVAPPVLAILSTVAMAGLLSVERAQGQGLQWFGFGTTLSLLQTVIVVGVAMAVSGVGTALALATARSLQPGESQVRRGGWGSAAAGLVLGLLLMPYTPESAFPVASLLLMTVVARRLVALLGWGTRSRRAALAIDGLLVLGGAGLVVGLMAGVTGRVLMASEGCPATPWLAGDDLAVWGASTAVALVVVIGSLTYRRLAWTWTLGLLVPLLGLHRWIVPTDVEVPVWEDAKGRPGACLPPDDAPDQAVAASADLACCAEGVCCPSGVAFQGFTVDEGLHRFRTTWLEHPLEPAWQVVRLDEAGVWVGARGPSLRLEELADTVRDLADDAVVVVEASRWWTVRDAVSVCASVRSGACFVTDPPPPRLSSNR